MCFVAFIFFLEHPIIGVGQEHCLPKCHTMALMFQIDIKHHLQLELDYKTYYIIYQCLKEN